MNVGEMHGFDVHPAAGIFPLIDGDDFRRLVEDIRANGLADEVTLDSDGLLIDGRNRVRACQEAGVEVRTRRFDGDVVQYVVSHNLHRRHLTNRQRAMVAGRLANLPHGGDRGNQYSGGKTPNGDLPPSRAAVKKLLGVSEGSLHRARVINRDGSPSLVALTDDDKVPLNTAATVAASLDDAEQDAFVKQVRAGADPSKIAPKRAKTKAAVSPPDKSVAGVRARYERIRKMAGQGYSSRQIADKVNITAPTVRLIAREHGIDIPADKAIGRTRQHDSNRIARQIVHGLEGTRMSLELINYDQLDRAEAAHWATSLTDSWPALIQFHKKIKEMTQ